MQHFDEYVRQGEHSWYFRNALVRANFNDLKNDIHATTEYLMRFFGNLLLNENNILKNRELAASSESVVERVVSRKEITTRQRSGQSRNKLKINDK